MKSRHGRIRVLFWAAAAFTFVMAVLPHPPDLPGHPSDKVQHVVAFATLAGLASWAFDNVRSAWILVGLSIFGAAIEIAQSIPALSRDGDPRDWLADTVAVGLVLLISGALRARR